MKSKILKKLSLFILLTCLAFLSSCNPYYLERFAQGLSSGVAASNAVSYNKKLMLFGGNNHDVYLGCLSCNEYTTDSIFNNFSTYGSKFSSKSIWNNYGSYGSKYSNYSPWNPYAQNPPVVVDQNGNFYGYFTVNKYLPKRTTVDFLVKILDQYENYP